MTLDEITVSDILHYLDTTHYDTHLGWLSRAYVSAGDPPQKGFLDMVEMELDAVRVLLPKGDTIKLYRGLNRPIENERTNLHWTESYAVAQQHGRFVYVTSVAPEQVDWLGTVVRRISWPKEQEISLHADANPEIVRYGMTEMRHFMDIVGGSSEV